MHFGTQITVVRVCYYPVARCCLPVTESRSKNTEFNGCASGSRFDMFQPAYYEQKVEARKTRSNRDAEVIGAEVRGRSSTKASRWLLLQSTYPRPFRV
jgi:hypothetical protein